MASWRWVMIVALPVGLLATSACKKGGTEQAAEAPAEPPKSAVTEVGTDKPLYDRLGGVAAVDAVVEELLVRAEKNPEVNFLRMGVNGARTPEASHKCSKHGLVMLICQATGGPQQYRGEDLKQAHAGFKITDAEFNALAAELKGVLVDLKVPAREQDELIAIVASLRPQIVEVAS